MAVLTHEPREGSPATAPQVGPPADSAPPGVQHPPEQWPTGRLFSAVARRIERDWNARLAHWDLNHASLPVLYLLSGGPLSQRELALASGVTEQTMSRILARLERQEYVARRTHADDRRRHEVHLSDLGRTTLGEAGDAEIAEAMSMRGLTATQVAALRQLLLTMLAVGPAAGAQLADTPDPTDEGCADDAVDGARG